MLLAQSGSSEQGGVMEREEGESQPKILRVGILTRVPGLDPRRSVDRLSSLAVSQIFETPYGLPKGEEPAEPVLFSGPLYREDDSGNVLSASVRPGIHFSDGTEMTAEHVVASLRTVQEFSEEAEVRAEGDRVIFTLKCPNPRFDLALTLVHCSIVLERGDELLGTGPFIPAPGTNLEDLRLVRNPHFRKPIALDEVAFRVFPPAVEGRPESLLKALEAGEVDFTNMLSRSDVSAVHGFRKAFQPSNSTAILFFNTERPRLSDPIFRRALTRAVDKRRVTEICYRNVDAFVATSLLPPMMGAGRERLVFDLEGAKRDLKAAGGPPAEPLRMLVVWAPRPYLPKPGPVAEELAHQLGEIGVPVEIEMASDADEFFKRQRRGEFDLLLGGWIADNADASEFLEATLLSDRIPAPGLKGTAYANLARICSPALDRALENFRCINDAENRERIQDLLADHAPLVPLMYGPSIVVHAWNLQNVVISPLGEPRFWTIDFED